MSLTDEQTEKIFANLAKLNEEQTKIEDEINDYATKKLIPMYEKRRELVKDVPKFWPAVLINSGMVEDYLSPEDLGAIEAIKEFDVEFDKENIKNFTIHFEFDDDNEFLDSKKVSKTFTYHPAEGEDKPAKYTSEPVKLEWKKGQDLTKRDDESFFKWFDFVGEGPGDYKGGEVLALTLIEDVFPHALKHYTDSSLSDDEIEGEFDLEDEDDEEEEGEGEKEEHEDAPPKKKQKN